VEVEVEEDRRMAAANPGMVQLGLLNKCVNCLVFCWGQPEELTTLKKCKQCKVVQYCSESCQKEHWKRVHKKHCKEIASAGQLITHQEIGDQKFWISLGVFSHHPFSASELPGNPMVTLLMLAQKILLKMQFRNQPAYVKVSSQLAQLQGEMAQCMASTWARKKTYPEKFNWVTDWNQILVFYNQNQDRELAIQDLWSILHLILGRLAECEIVNMVNSLKDPHGAVPPELWSGFEKEVGPFPNRVGELIKALSGDEFPSFQDLLKILCGGNLRQDCSFCLTRMDVAAVAGEVEGCYVGIPTVSILPFMPPLFSCGAETCGREISGKEKAFTNLGFGLSATKFQSTRCDYCFLLSEKAHRCRECLTKTYCSEECGVKDKKKHFEFCKKDVEERKVKGGSKARVEAGLKQLEVGLEEVLKLEQSEKWKKNMVEVKEMCEKQGGKDKRKSDGGKS